MRAASGVIHARSLGERRMLGAGAGAVVAVLEGDRLDLACVGETHGFVVRDRRLWGVTATFTEATCAPWPDDPDEQAERVATRVAYMRARALGFLETVDPWLCTITLRAGDVLLLCSDALVTIGCEDAIAAGLAGAADARIACAALTDMTAGMPVDATLLVARPKGEALLPPSPKDTLPAAPHTIVF
jgi:hypothetical protein